MTDKFDWLATESAPKNYPMEIVTGDFIYPDGGSLYVPNEKTIHKGWGNFVSTHIVDPDLKPLPKRLDITYFSYTEDKFYQGSFELPYDKILDMFNEGYYSPKEHADTTYSNIMAGVAPGGAVAVWVMGTDKVTEVFFGKAEKANVPWNRIMDNDDISREEFVRLEVEETISTEALDSLKRDGIPYGLWDTYRTRYHWQPVITAVNPPKLFNVVSYFNGELDYLRYPLEEPLTQEKRTIPDKITFFWVSPEGQPLSIKVYFNEAEIFEAFKQFAPTESTANQVQLQLEFRIETTDQGRETTVWLRNKDEEIQLKKATIDIRKTRLTADEIEDYSTSGT